MARQQKPSPTAVAYAKSLLELANESKSAEAVAQELDVLRQLIAENPTFRVYLDDPAIGIIERQQMLSKIFGKHLSKLVLNFLGVVNEHGRLRILQQIIDAHEDLLGEQLGKVDVDVFVAKKLPSDDLEKVRKRVSAALKKDAVVHQYVDESVIGGLVLRVGDKLIDASVRYQLAALKEKLAHAPVPESI